jgi:hypothetical protein
MGVTKVNGRGYLEEYASDVRWISDKVLLRKDLIGQSASV